MHILKDGDFFVQDANTGKSRPNVENLKDHFLHEGRLTESQALFILDQTTTLLKQEPNMLPIDGPVTGTFSNYSDS